MDIISDETMSIVEDSNPIHNIKEKELVTYIGAGGRSAQSMVKRSRVYHPSDIGLISESTPDSSKVAINSYMSANPNLVSLRGMTRPYDPKIDGVASVVSTSAVLSPGATNDDAKRVTTIAPHVGNYML